MSKKQQQAQALATQQQQQQQQNAQNQNNTINQNISTLILEPLDQNKYRNRLNEEQTATPRLTSRQHRKLTTIQSSLENLPIVRNAKEKYALHSNNNNNELDRLSTIDQPNKIKFEKRNKGGKNLPPLNDETIAKIDSQQFDMKAYKLMHPRNSSVNQDLSQYEHLTLNPINQQLQNSNINSEEYKISNVKNGGALNAGLQIQHKYSLESLPMINMSRSPIHNNQSTKNNIININNAGVPQNQNLNQQSRHDQSISFMDEKSLAFEEYDGGQSEWNKNINKKKKHLKGAINSQLHQAGGQGQQQLPQAVVRQSGVNMSIQEIARQGGVNDQGNKISFPKI